MLYFHCAVEDSPRCHKNFLLSSASRMTVCFFPTNSSNNRIWFDSNRRFCLNWFDLLPHFSSFEPNHVEPSSQLKTSSHCSDPGFWSAIATFTIWSVSSCKLIVSHLRLISSIAIFGKHFFARISLASSANRCSVAGDSLILSHTCFILCLYFVVGLLLIRYSITTLFISLLLFFFVSVLDLSLDDDLLEPNWVLQACRTRHDPRSQPSLTRLFSISSLHIALPFKVVI